MTFVPEEDDPEEDDAPPPEEDDVPPVMVYVVMFRNQFTVLSGLELEGSPGAIAFETVDVVAIENSDFR